MRILVEVVHPAHVLFFKNAIERMQARGDIVKIVSRHKDITCDLLEQFGFPHQPISIAGQGKFGLAKELVIRDLRLLKIARNFRPDIMLGFGGVAISHVGKLINTPSVSFYDTDTATLQNSLTWPFISHLYVPQAFSAPVPVGRTSRFNGGKELSYFHPENFRANDKKALENGWDKDRPNFFIRTVSWGANHDMGKTGWSHETVQALIAKLSPIGKIHFSSENALPKSLEQYRFIGTKSEVHHLLAKCRLYIGESATMASEAGMLGVPAIYDGFDHPGSTKAQADSGMITILRHDSTEALLAAVDRLLDNDAVEKLQKNRAVYLADRPNLSDLIMEAVDLHARKTSV